MIRLLAIICLLSLKGATVVGEISRRDVENFIARQQFGGLISVLSKANEPVTRSLNVSLSGKGPLVQLGELSDLLPVIAVLQLVETNRVPLDEKIVLPETFVPPQEAIPTLRQILLHSAGLDSTFLNLVSSVLSVFTCLAIHRQVPDEYFFSLDFVIPSDTVYSYSQNGIAIIALIVEQETGIGVHEYIQKNILEPIGMEDTFPLTASFNSSLDAFEVFVNGRSKKPPRQYRLGTTAWRFSLGAPRYASTISDIVKFVKMLVNEGIVSNNLDHLHGTTPARVLERKTYEVLTMGSYAHGFALRVTPGFFEKIVDGYRTLYRHCGKFGTSSSVLIMLVPALDMGIVVASEKPDNVASLIEITREFFAQFILETQKTEVTAVMSWEPEDEFQGEYRPLFFPINSPSSLFPSISHRARLWKLPGKPGAMLSLSILGTSNALLNVSQGMLVSPSGSHAARLVSSSKPGRQRFMCLESSDGSPVSYILDNYSTREALLHVLFSVSALLWAIKSMKIRRLTVFCAWIHLSLITQVLILGVFPSLMAILGVCIQATAIIGQIILVISLIRWWIGTGASLRLKEFGCICACTLMSLIAIYFRLIVLS